LVDDRVRVRGDEGSEEMIYERDQIACHFDRVANSLNEFLPTGEKITTGEIVDHRKNKAISHGPKAANLGSRALCDGIRSDVSLHKGHHITMIVVEADRVPQPRNERIAVTARREKRTATPKRFHRVVFFCERCVDSRGRCGVEATKGSPCLVKM
jgi:hypothetical protein